MIQKQIIPTRNTLQQWKWLNFRRGKGHVKPRLMWQPNELPKKVRQNATAMRYHKMLVSIAWDKFPERVLITSGRKAPIPYWPFAAACLVKLNQGMTYMSQLHEYLTEHPELSWLLGFEQPLPTARHFTRMLRQAPNEVFQFLLDESVRLVQEACPDDTFGETISLDTKHILAWVKQNNPKLSIENRYEAEQSPADPDCRVGCKKKHNRYTPATDAQPASSTEVGEFYWGYASGVVVTKTRLGEVVLAELTQPFNASDVSYFDPLMQQTARRLDKKPRFGTFDAAFDAFMFMNIFTPKVASGRMGLLRCRSPSATNDA